MVRRNKRYFALTTSVAAAALLVAACGGNGARGDNSAVNEGNGGTGEGGPERVYIEAIVGDPSVLNPQFGGGPIPIRIGMAMMEPLVGITDEYEIVPVLAKEWDISEDGLTITFELQEGVEWHDGEP